MPTEIPTTIEIPIESISASPYTYTISSGGDAVMAAVPRTAYTMSVDTGTLSVALSDDIEAAVETKMAELRKLVGRDLAILSEFCRDCICGAIDPSERDAVLADFEKELENRYGLVINHTQIENEE